jgi:hypothetical protein
MNLQLEELFDKQEQRNKEIGYYEHQTLLEVLFFMKQINIEDGLAQYRDDENYVACIGIKRANDLYEHVLEELENYTNKLKDEYEI